jgi:hypothetical protein
MREGIESQGEWTVAKQHGELVWGKGKSSRKRDRGCRNQGTCFTIGLKDAIISLQGAVRGKANLISLIKF